MAAQPETPNKEQVQEEPLKYKTWNMKVSIHCEGCKKKVKKILQNTEGVYTVDIDRKQQKVTVTGNVEADTLLKKLNKAGRHAELWPEKPAKSKKNKEKSQSESTEVTVNEESANEKEKSSVKVEVIVQEIGKNSDGSSSSGGGAAAGTGKVSGGADGGVQVKEVRFEGKNPDASVSGDHTPPPAATVADSEIEIGSGSGNGGKKKKKKGQNGNDKVEENKEVEHHFDHAPASTGSPIYGQSQTHYMPPANYGPPRQQMYQQYPPYYHGPPVHAVSYNMAPYPSTAAHTSLYYTAPPPYSHAYTYSGSGSPASMVEPPMPDYESYPPQQRRDSFEFFSDENPNACEIM